MLKFLLEFAPEEKKKIDWRKIIVITAVLLSSENSKTQTYTGTLLHIQPMHAYVARLQPTQFSVHWG